MNLVASNGVFCKQHENDLQAGAYKAVYASVYQISLVIQKLHRIHVNLLLVELHGSFGHPLWVISKISVSGNQIFSLVTKLSHE